MTSGGGVFFRDIGRRSEKGPSPVRDADCTSGRRRGRFNPMIHNIVFTGIRRRGRSTRRGRRSGGKEGSPRNDKFEGRDGGGGTGETGLVINHPYEKSF